MPQLGKTLEERKRVLYRGGVTIQTTLDPRIQKLTQLELTKRVPIGDPSRVGAAAYVTDPNTGKVLAFAQNTTYTVDKESSGKTGINWALDQRWGGSGGFQFGSTAKAFALVTAMESGMKHDASVNAKAAGDGHMASYQPKDFPGGLRPGQYLERRQRHVLAGRQHQPDEGDGAVDQHGLRRPRPAARRVQGA